MCDPEKLAKLDHPGRLEQLDPSAMYEALGRPEVSVWVDVGAGTGIITAAFARLMPAATFYGADTSPEAVAWMREHRDEAREGRLLPLLAEESRVPLDDGVADVVSMIALHHELADKHASYTEAMRLLRPGGQLLVVDWKPIETPKGPPLSLRVTAQDIADAAKEAGFADVSIHDVLAEHSVITAARRLG